MFQAANMEKLNSVLEWISRLYILQLVWILFSLAGLLFGGVFPATFTMFAMYRKWLRNPDEQFPIIKTFLTMYRENFIKTNLLGWGMLITGFSIYYYFQLFKGPDDIIQLLLFGIVILIGILYVLTVLYIIPIFVHYDVKIMTMVRYAIVIAVANPLHILSMGALIVGMILAMSLFPALLPFFSISPLACGLMWIALSTFNKVENKVVKKE
nr:DUF624 domain-containing protein [Fredinandcohnia onubensis]